MEQRIHVAIIMDGNGRWARQRGLPRAIGHRSGAEAVRRIVEHAARVGVDTLTLYAFSSDNWKRPQEEVGALLKLFRTLLETEVQRCLQNDIRLSFIGRRDRMPAALRTAMAEGERATAAGRRMHLRLAVDYSARDAIVEAARALPETATREDFARALGAAYHAEGAPDVDLLIRTGGEQRLSDFLLWEAAYAELYFTEVMWPDFAPEHLDKALQAFHCRERRFGSLVKAD